MIEESRLGRSQGRWFVTGDAFYCDAPSGLGHRTRIIANTGGSDAATLRGFRAGPMPRG